MSRDEAERKLFEEVAGVTLRREVDRLGILLDAASTNHAQTPPQKVKHRVIDEIRLQFGGDPVTCGEFGRALIESTSPGAREIGVMLLWPLAEIQPGFVVDAIQRVGDDENWEVREWAATGLARAIPVAFAKSLPWLERWSVSESPNLRRMVAVAVGYAMRDCGSDRGLRLLGLLTPLMADTNPYVRKNLGPYALGSYAVRYEPRMTARWAMSLDPSNVVVALNIAQMCTTTAAAGQRDVLSQVLVWIGPDERPRVARAIRKAQENLGITSSNQA